MKSLTLRDDVNPMSASLHIGYLYVGKSRPVTEIGGRNGKEGDNAG